VEEYDNSNGTTVVSVNNEMECTNIGNNEEKNDSNR
jgi:hypothetical protein